MIQWTPLRSLADLEQAKAFSATQKVLIFKHSTRCSISSAALSRLERSWNDSEMNHLKPYFLDVIASREVSNAVAADLGIRHESPQVLVIENGACVYDNSHMGIHYADLQKLAITA